jgi:hypothetical protein
VATIAAIALASCSSQQNGMLPSSPSEAAPASTDQSAGTAPTTALGSVAPKTAAHDESASDDSTSDDAATDDATAMTPDALKTCATTPPQYEWVFKGACQTFTLQPSGGHFALGEYQSITLKGLIGKNTLKSSAKIALADALDKNGDVVKYQGKTFTAYHGQGTTFLYAAAVNQSSQTIKPITVKGKPVLQYVITDAKGYGSANVCAAAVLTFPRGKPPKWTSLPGGPFQIKSKTVTINQYTTPSGVELAPKIPLYFAVNCWKQ